MKPLSRLSAIKAAQKESVIYRAIAPRLQAIIQENPKLEGIYLNKASLTPGKTLCYLFLYSPEGEEHCLQGIDILKLYIPSLRKAVAHELNSRYAPDILFVYDAQHAKVLKLESLLEKVKSQNSVYHDNDTHEDDADAQNSTTSGS